MDRMKFCEARRLWAVGCVAILLIFFQTGFADVSHNQDFPVSGLSIQALFEPANSNV